MMKTGNVVAAVLTVTLAGGFCLQLHGQGVCMTNLTWKLSRHARIEGKNLIVDVPRDKANEGGFGLARVNMSAFSGQCYAAYINASLAGVSKPSQKWSGLMFQFHYVNSETGGKYWSNVPQNFRHHDFPMQTISVSDMNFGRELGFVDLRLGLTGASGKAVFDLSTLVIEGQDAFFPVVNQEYRISYPKNVAARPPSRGVMLPIGPYTEDDFRTLHEWGATLARYQMTRNFLGVGVNRDLEDYDLWLDGKLDHLERDVLPWAMKYGIKIVVDLHTPPGGRDPDKDWSMYHDEKFADHFVECWRRIASRFKGRPGIYGYDLVNEPLQTRPAVCDYWTAQKRAAEAIRKIDPDTTIIVESNGWDAPDTFSYLAPLAMDNVIYEVHTYAPLEFTHQQMAWAGNFGKCAYPNKDKGWDIDYIRRKLEPVRKFEKKHNAKIYVGEFSANAWAEGADKYIADCISVFEEYGWDWTYHAFREDKAWSVEHEPDDWQKRTYKPSSDNPRRQALLDGFRRKP